MARLVTGVLLKATEGLDSSSLIPRKSLAILKQYAPGASAAPRDGLQKALESGATPQQPGKVRAWVSRVA